MTHRIRFIAVSVCALAILVIVLIVLRNLGFQAGARAFKAGDYASALRIIRPLARLGDTPSQYVLGEMYAFGFGVVKDDSKAIYWFRRAAVRSEEGVDPAAPAELAVSKSYAEGIGVKADRDESLKWLRLAAKGGSKEAGSRLQSYRTP